MTHPVKYFMIATDDYFFSLVELMDMQKCYDFYAQYCILKG